MPGYFFRSLKTFANRFQSIAVITFRGCEGKRFPAAFSRLLLSSFKNLRSYLLLAGGLALVVVDHVVGLTHPTMDLHLVSEFALRVGRLHAHHLPARLI